MIATSTRPGPLNVWWKVREMMEMGPRLFQKNLGWWNMGVSKNSGTPKSSFLYRVFHYKPSILGYPYFWKHPFMTWSLTSSVSLHPPLGVQVDPLIQMVWWNRKRPPYLTSRDLFRQPFKGTVVYVIWMVGLTYSNTFTTWWFQTFFIFTPTWGRFPIWLIFFKWVETTNQFGRDLFHQQFKGTVILMVGLTYRKHISCARCPVFFSIVLNIIFRGLAVFRDV